MAREIVLISKDDELLGVLRAPLSKAGFQVKELGAINEVRALASPPELIIVDLDSGSEALAHLKQSGIANEIASLAVTGDLRDLSVLQQLRETGVKGFLRKGFSQEELMFKIKAIQPRTVDMRKNDRVLASIPVVYEAAGAKHETMSFSFSSDGVFLRTVNPPDPGQVVTMNMTLPGQESAISCKAKVLYVVKYDPEHPSSYPPGMALIFESLSEKAKTQIHQFVATQSTEGS